MISPVKREPQDIRDFDVIGHHVRVIRTANQLWQVSVDGDPVDGGFALSHEAWAVGVAESYRRGPVEGERILGEADHDPWPSALEGSEVEGQ